MPVIDYKNLKNQLNEIQKIKIAMLYGEQAYLILEVITAITKLADKLNLEIIRFSGENININDVNDSVESFSFNLNKKLVLIKDMDISKLSQEQFDTILSIANNPNPETIIIFYQTITKFDFRTSRAKKLYSEIEKNGFICDISIKNINLIKDGLCEYARKNNKILSSSNALLLIERSSNNYNILINELNKLISFSNNDEITKSDIFSSVIASFNSSSFDLAKNILANNFNKSFSILHELIYSRQDGVLIIGALSMAFIDIYRAKLTIISGKSSDEMQSDFNYPKNRQFAVSKSIKDCSNFELQHIKLCLNILIKTDESIKSSKINQHILLEKAISSMFLSSKIQG